MRSRGVAAALLAAAGICGPGVAGAESGAAGGLLFGLGPADRAILHDEMIEALVGLPELLAGVAPVALSTPVPDAADIYADHVEADLADLATHRDALFSPDRPGFGAAGAATTVALFTAADCPDCARAETDLRALAETHDLRVTLINIDADAALAQALGLDTAPSYVFDDMMLRGHIPPVVLKGYLDR
ncbi:MAG: glutaredoxin family protein [Roseovarius sp.]|nr:glutaredoxin family protein [Roseovarius sp.]